MAYLPPRVFILDTTTQAIAVANTPQAITFDTNNVLLKAAHSTSTDPSRITVNETGGYLISFSGQSSLGIGAIATLDIWFRINGTDVANSNTKITLVNASDQKKTTIVRAISMTAGQYLEVVMSGDTTNLSLLATVAGVTPTRPATPSATILLAKIS